MPDKNNWYVITGGPCAGKTSVAKILEKKGYRVQYEMARAFIDWEIANGKKVENIRKDEEAFQKKILHLKVRLEKKLPKSDLIIFDRGIPDSISYYKIAGISSNDKHLRKAVKNCSYKKVFLLELLDFQKDYARTDQKKAKEIHRSLEMNYRKIGIPIIKVPVMLSKKDRVDFIIKNL